MSKRIALDFSGDKDTRTGLIEGLVALSESLNRKGERDVNTMNVVIYEIDTARVIHPNSEVRVTLKMHGVEMVVIGDGFHYKCYKRNDWYWTNDVFARREMLHGGGPEGRAKDIENLLAFLYRPFDPENDMDIVKGQPLPKHFDKAAWEAGV